MLTGWQGVYVEASRDRARSFVNRGRHTILRNAITNKTGQIVQLNNLKWDGASSISQKSVEDSYKANKKRG